MKTRLPKALLLAVLACSTSYAATDPDNWTGAFFVQEANTIKVESGEADWKDELPDGKTAAAILNQGGISGSTNTKPQPVVKDGQGTLVIDGSADTESLKIQNPILVREGTLLIRNKEVESDVANISNYIPYLTIGGNNAELKLDNAKLSNTTGSVAAIVVGTPDGVGKLSLSNDSYLHTEQYLMAGDHDGMQYNLGSGNYAALGTGYSKFSYSEVDGTATRYANGQQPSENNRTVINIESGSTLDVGASLQIADADIIIDGPGSKLIDNTRYANDAISGKPQLTHDDAGSYLGYDKSYTGDVITNIKITNGGAYDCQWNLCTGGDTSAIGDGKTGKNYVNITVEGTGTDENDNKVASSISVVGNMTLGGNLCAGEKPNSETVFTVKDGGVAYLNVVNVGTGDTGTAKMVVENGSTIFKHSGAKYADKATGTGVNEPVIIVGKNGTLENRGTIDLDIIVQSGGKYIGDVDPFGGYGAMAGYIVKEFTKTFTALDGSIVEHLTMSTGTLNLSGEVTFKGATLGTLDQSAETPLTLNVEAGTVINTEGTNALVIYDDVVIQVLSDGFQEGTLLTIKGNPVLSVDEKILSQAYYVNDAGEVYGVADLVWNTPKVGDYTVTATNFRMIPEPTTATLSLLALLGLAARRRRTA